MDLQHNISAARHKLNLTQAEVARRLGMDATNYNRTERRGNKISIDQANEIASAIGISLMELLNWGQKAGCSDKQHAELIDSLNARVIELEDRLRDKQFIITKLIEDKDYTVSLNEQLIAINEDLRTSIR